MLFPVEEDVTDSDLQLRLCVGDSADRAQTPHGSDSDEAKEIPPHHPLETLDLSRSRLQEVSEDLLKNWAVKYLYLEGNELQSIPPSLFTSLPNLLWLDLRHNRIQFLPAEIGRHRCLRTLLLEGNPITELPPELGNVLSLNGLNVRDCPLRYPPRGVLQRGVLSVLQYLRAALAQRPVSAPKSLPDADAPVVERLQLELESSVEEEEEEEGTVEEDELERFRELKLQMSLMEQFEQEEAAKPPKQCSLPLLKRKKATQAGGTPVRFSAPLWNKCEERRQAERREKEAILEQRRKSHEALHEWRTQAKDPQQARHRQKKPGRLRTEEGETDTRPGAEDGGDLAPRQANSISEYEECRAVQKLRQKIHALVQKMEEKRRNPTGSKEEQIEAAERDIREMRRLQAQILEVKRRRGLAVYSTHP